MKTHLLGNQHQWIIESHYEDKEEFDFHWDKKVFPSETREDVSDQTSTYRGKQFNIHPDAYVNEWKFKPHLQEQIDKVGLPIQITDLCALWIIEYKKGLDTKNSSPFFLTLFSTALLKSIHVVRKEKQSRGYL